MDRSKSLTWEEFEAGTINIGPSNGEESRKEESEPEKNEETKEETKKENEEEEKEEGNEQEGEVTAPEDQDQDQEGEVTAQEGEVTAPEDPSYHTKPSHVLAQELSAVNKDLLKIGEELLETKPGSPERKALKNSVTLLQDRQSSISQRSHKAENSSTRSDPQAVSQNELRFLNSDLANIQTQLLNAPRKSPEKKALEQTAALLVER